MQRFDEKDLGSKGGVLEYGEASGSKRTDSMICHIERPGKCYEETVVIIYSDKFFIYGLEEFHQNF